MISSGTVLIYVTSPGNVGVDDIGKPVSITVYTNNAQAITECIVESATSQ